MQPTRGFLGPWICSAIPNKGHLAFMLFNLSLHASVLVRFLARFVRQVPKNFYVILDSHSAQAAGPTHHWMEEHSGRIEVLFLPTYAPDLNADELRNIVVKANSLSLRPPATRIEMIGGVGSYLCSTKRRRDVVQNFFRRELVRYAV